MADKDKILDNIYKMLQPPKPEKKQKASTYQEKLAWVRNQYLSGAIDDSARMEMEAIVTGTQAKPKIETPDSVKIYTKNAEDALENMRKLPEDIRDNPEHPLRKKWESIAQYWTAAASDYMGVGQEKPVDLGQGAPLGQRIVTYPEFGRVTPEMPPLMPRPATAEEARKLEPGTMFVTPQGKIKIR